MPALPSPCPGAAVALRRRRRSPAWREVRVTCRDVRVPAGKAALHRARPIRTRLATGLRRPRDQGGGGPHARAPASRPRRDRCAGLRSPANGGAAQGHGEFQKEGTFSQSEYSGSATASLFVRKPVSLF